MRATEESVFDFLCFICCLEVLTLHSKGLTKNCSGSVTWRGRSLSFVLMKKRGRSIFFVLKNGGGARGVVILQSLLGGCSVFRGYTVFRGHSVFRGNIVFQDS